MSKVIRTEPRSFELWGLSAKVPDRNYGAVGLRLMNEMWSQLKSGNVRNAGINHWVYPDRETLLVGVELLSGESAPEGFEHIQFTLGRYLEHLHVGAYQLLPTVWQTLISQLNASGEALYGPSLEIYGHQSPDPNSIPETTILIGLKAN